MSKIFIGMSGWTFEGWRKGFYPEGLSQKKELEYASLKVTSIEINGTFYSLQRPTSFTKWYEETPDDFVFALKAPQYITHVRRLKEVEEPLANFFASGVFCLKEKLGPILWQFPPNVTLKDDRFTKFLELLPFDSKAASKLAKKHSEKMNDRNVTKVHDDYPIRHAFEFRHMSFMNPEFVELLRKYGVAIVFGHAGDEKYPYMEDVTADFVYARMHGRGLEYKKGYPDETLEWWAKRLESWTAGGQPSDAQCMVDKNPKNKKRDAYVYFDTNEKEFAPYDAMTLIRKIK
ncbi:MAG: hypothetical protein A4S09_12495 [Proteobacteria bacterium SG_bin7]|nr:MAG: hypothetical protein A4S09_12495 [Proteobacteria bacterium SG_bin7]